MRYGQEYTLLRSSINVEKEKDKKMNGEVGRPKLPFQASSPRRAGQAYERDTLAAATQAAIKTDDPIVRPPVLEKPSSMLGQGTLTCGTGRGLGTGWKSTVTGVRHLNSE